MTCIVGITTGSKVYIGGDSAGVGGWSLTIRADQKVFRRGDYVFGFTSSYRMGQILQYNAELPAPPREDVHKFMVRDFVEAVRKALRDGGYTKIDSNREEGGTFLVGCRARLFAIESDFQVVETTVGFDAVGSGADIARGALTASPRLSPERRVRTALSAAEQWNAGVRGPFTVVSV